MGNSNVAYLVIAKVFAGLTMVLTVPIYLHFLGLEAVGFINFMTMIQALLIVVDLGFSPVVTRFLSQANDDEQARAFKRNALFTLEVTQYVIVGFFGVLLTLLLPFLLFSWSQSNLTSTAPTPSALLSLLAGFSALLFLPLGLLVAALSAQQRNKILANYLLATSITRLLVVMVALSFYPTLITFFMMQITISLVALFSLRRIVWSSMPQTESTFFSISSVLPHMRFGAVMTGIAMLGVFLAQADRLVLSVQLSLKDFAHYSLAASLAAGVFVIITAFFSTYFSRFSAQWHQGRFQEQTIEESLQAAQVLGLILLTIACFFFFFAEPILWVWLGDREIARQAYPILKVLMLANVCNGLMNIPYALQLAAGRAAQVLKINIIGAVIVLPCFWFASRYYGALGAALTWLALNVGFIIFWPRLVFLPLLGISSRRWYWQAIVLPMLVAFPLSGVLFIMFSEQTSKLHTFLFLIFLLSFQGAASALLLPKTRLLCLAMLRRFRF